MNEIVIVENRLQSDYGCALDGFAECHQTGLGLQSPATASWGSPISLIHTFFVYVVTCVCLFVKNKFKIFCLGFFYWPCLPRQGYYCV
jgi:hypothetical protein